MYLLESKLIFKPFIFKSCNLVLFSKDSFFDSLFTFILYSLTTFLSSRILILIVFSFSSNVVFPDISILYEGLDANAYTSILSLVVVISYSNTSGSKSIFSLTNVKLSNLSL